MKLLSSDKLPDMTKPFKTEKNASIFGPTGKETQNILGALKKDAAVFISAPATDLAMGVCAELAAALSANGVPEGRVREMVVHLFGGGGEIGARRGRTLDDLLGVARTIGTPESPAYIFVDFLDETLPSQMRRLALFLNDSRATRDLNAELQAHHLKLLMIGPAAWSVRLRERYDATALTVLDYNAAAAAVRGHYAEFVESQDATDEALQVLPQRMDVMLSQEIAGTLRARWERIQARIKVRDRREDGSFFNALRLITRDLQGAQIAKASEWDAALLKRYPDEEDDGGLIEFLRTQTEPQATILFVMGTFDRLPFEEFERLCLILLMVRDGRTKPIESTTSAAPLDVDTLFGTSYTLSYGQGASKRAADDFKKRSDELRRDLGIELEFGFRPGMPRVARFDQPAKSTMLGAALKDTVASYGRDSMDVLISSQSVQDSRLLERMVEPLAAHILSGGNSEDTACLLLRLLWAAGVQDRNDPVALATVLEKREGDPRTENVSRCAKVIAQLLYLDPEAKGPELFLDALLEVGQLGAYQLIARIVDQETPRFDGTRVLLKALQSTRNRTKDGVRHTELLGGLVADVMQGARASQDYIAYTDNVLRETSHDPVVKRIAAELTLRVFSEATSDIFPTPDGRSGTKNAFLNRHLFGGDEDQAVIFRLLRAPELRDAVTQILDAPSGTRVDQVMDDQVVYLPAHLYIHATSWFVRPAGDTDLKTIGEQMHVSLLEEDQTRHEKATEIRDAAAKVVLSTASVENFVQNLGTVKQVEWFLKATHNEAREIVTLFPWFVAFEWWLVVRGTSEPPIETNERFAEQFLEGLCRDLKREEIHELQRAEAYMNLKIARARDLALRMDLPRSDRVAYRSALRRKQSLMYKFKSSSRALLIKGT